MNDPLSEDQLRQLGFQIFYKKRKGQNVFDSCSIHHKECSWEQDELVGTFHSPPSFLQIVDQIAENAKSKEYWRIIEKLAQNLINGLDV